ncbi:MAG: glycosyltransferase family 4 protein [Ignavibacteriae bacterium]|nr:glycosyltransferase family 4 protein [Ignavibacteriota bacterium]
MPPKKKILLIGSLPPPVHGSNVYFNNLINSEIKNEFDIAHLDISDHRDLKNLSKLDLTNVTLALKSIIDLRKKLKDFRPDLVYIPVASNFLPYLRDGLFILVSDYFSDARIILHSHEGDNFRKGFYEGSPFFVKYFIEKSLGKADTIIVLGEKLRNVYSGLVKNIEVVPNGIQSEEINKDGKDIRKNRTSENVKIGFMGNLFESKGVLDVVNAAAIVLKKHPDVKFTIAGASPSDKDSAKEKADKIINENGLQESIKFPGVLTGKEKEDFFNKIDIFVFPSWYKYEGLPLVIPAAMSASLPVISVRETGVISEIVTENETGILINKKDPQKLAEAIDYLIENPEVRIEMGRKGREKFQKQFTLETNIDNIIRVFNKVLN